jgi:hypothetical protein
MSIDHTRPNGIIHAATAGDQQRRSRAQQAIDILSALPVRRAPAP